MQFMVEFVQYVPVPGEQPITHVEASTYANTLEDARRIAATAEHSAEIWLRVE
jgi:hypothetical protein